MLHLARIRAPSDKEVTIAMDSRGCAVGQSVLELQSSGQSFSPIFALDEWFQSTDSLYLITAEGRDDWQRMLMMWLARSPEQRRGLVLSGTTQLTPSILIEKLYAKWSDHEPVGASDFRQQLSQFVAEYLASGESALLVVTEVQNLPIATQAALVHLSHLVDRTGASFKILLAGDACCEEQLQPFFPLPFA